MPKHGDGPSRGTRFSFGFGRNDAHLLDLKDGGADHKCKETENAIQNTLRIMREAPPYM